MSHLGTGKRNETNLLFVWFFLWRIARRRSAVLNNVLDFPRGDFFSRNAACLACVGVHQRRRSAGDLACPACGYQNVTVITVKSIHQLHKALPRSCSPVGEEHYMPVSSI